MKSAEALRSDAAKKTAAGVIRPIREQGGYVTMEDVKKALNEEELKQATGGSFVVDGEQKKDGVFEDKCVDKGEKQKDWFDQAPQKDIVIIE